MLRMAVSTNSVIEYPYGIGVRVGVGTERFALWKRRAGRLLDPPAAVSQEGRPSRSINPSLEGPPSVAVLPGVDIAGFDGESGSKTEPFRYRELAGAVGGAHRGTPRCDTRAKYICCIKGAFGTRAMSHFLSMFLIL